MKTYKGNLHFVVAWVALFISTRLLFHQDLFAKWPLSVLYIALPGMIIYHLRRTVSPLKYFYGAYLFMLLAPVIGVLSYWFSSLAIPSLWYIFFLALAILIGIYISILFIRSRPFKNPNINHLVHFIIGVVLFGYIALQLMAIPYPRNIHTYTCLIILLAYSLLAKEKEIRIMSLYMLIPFALRIPAILEHYLIQKYW